LVALAAAGCGSGEQSAAKLPVPRGKLIRVAVTKPPARRVHGIEFVKTDPQSAVRLFRRGKLDVAPVPLGDIQRVLRDRQLGQAVRITRLNAVDMVVAGAGGSLAGDPKLLQAYSDTADRADYQALVPELEAPPAERLTGPVKLNARAAAVAFSRSRKQISSLPRVAVRFAMPRDPELAYGANLLIAAWRDLGLGAHFGKGRPDARFVRVFDPRSEPAQKVIPIAWAVDAHLVSPRIRGWRESPRGVVDYAALRSRARRLRR
jgi:hypothetical protein